MWPSCYLKLCPLSYMESFRGGGLIRWPPRRPFACSRGTEPRSVHPACNQKQKPQAGCQRFPSPLARKGTPPLPADAPSTSSPSDSILKECIWVMSQEGCVPANGVARLDSKEKPMMHASQAPQASFTISPSELKNDAVASGIHPD